jgi:hypothetical protein
MVMGKQPSWLPEFNCFPYLPMGKGQNVFATASIVWSDDPQKQITAINCLQAVLKCRNI